MHLKWDQVGSKRTGNILFPSRVPVGSEWTVTETLYVCNHSSIRTYLCSVSMNSQIGEFLRTAVSVQEGHLLSPVLFSILSEMVMQDTLHNHHRFISNSGISVSSLQFTDVIDLLAIKSDELQRLVNILVQSAEAYDMDVSTENSKVLTNGANKTSADNILNG